MDHKVRIRRPTMKRALEDHVSENPSCVLVTELPLEVWHIILGRTTPSCRAVLYYTSKKFRSIVNSALHLKIDNKQKFIQNCARQDTLELLQWIIDLHYGVFPHHFNPKGDYDTFFDEFLNTAILHNSRSIVCWMMEQISDNTMVVYNRKPEEIMFFCTAITKNNYPAVSWCIDNMDGRHLEFLLELSQVQNAIACAGMDMVFYFIEQQKKKQNGTSSFETDIFQSIHPFKNELLKNAVNKGNLEDLEIICKKWVFSEFEDDRTQQTTDYAYVFNQALAMKCKSIKVLNYLWNKMKSTDHKRLKKFSFCTLLTSITSMPGNTLLWLLSQGFRMSFLNLESAARTGDIAVLDELYERQPIVSLKILRIASDYELLHVAKWAFQKGITYNKTDAEWVIFESSNIIHKAMIFKNTNLLEWLKEIVGKKNGNDLIVWGVKDLKMVQYVYDNFGYTITLHTFSPVFFATTYEQNPEIFEFLMETKKNEFAQNQNTAQCSESFLQFCLKIAKHNVQHGQDRKSFLCYLKWIKNQGYKWGIKDQKLLRYCLKCQYYLGVAEWLINQGVTRVSIPITADNLNIHYFPLSSRRMIRAYDISLTVVIQKTKDSS